MPNDVKHNLKLANKITLNRQMSLTEVHKKQRSIVVATTSDENSNVLGILSSWIPNIRNKINETFLQESLKTDAIDASIILKVKSGITDDGNPLLQLISEAAIENNDNLSSYYIEVPGHGKWNGSELRINKSVPITTINKLPQLDSVFSNLTNWLHSLIEESSI